MNVEIELQTALFSALSSPAYTVKDGWYEEEALPLINIGEMEIEEGGSKVNDDWYVTIAIHTWSANTSSAEIKNMNHHAREALESASIPGYRVTGRLVRTFSTKEAQTFNNGRIQNTKAVDVSLYHGVTFYRFYILKEELAHG